MEAETATGLGRAGRGWARLGEARRGWDEDQDPRLEVAGGGWRLVTGPRLTSRGAGRPAVRPRPVPHGLRHLRQSQPTHDWPNPG